MVWIRLMSMLLIVCLIALRPWGNASADEYQTLEDSSPQEVVDGMANKAGRGIVNMTTGWMEFPKQIYTTSQEEGVARGVLIGPLKGLGMTLVRTMTGVGELATFFLAYPGFYESSFEPDYVWQRE
jgi:putative exosortase-associated protein (TIGR04073 family)